MTWTLITHQGQTRSNTNLRWHFSTELILLHPNVVYTELDYEHFLSGIQESTFRIIFQREIQETSGHYIGFRILSQLYTSFDSLHSLPAYNWTEIALWAPDATLKWSGAINSSNTCDCIQASRTQPTNFHKFLSFTVLLFLSTATRQAPRVSLIT
jgi:hypothetical protein